MTEHIDVSITIFHNYVTDMSWQQPEEMPAFNRQLRDLRRARGATHRQIAEAVGLKPSSYQNAEHKPFKAMARVKVERLAAFYGLDAPAREALLAAWEDLPVSTYAQSMAPTWSKRRQARAKAKHHDAMQVALVEVLSLLLGGHVVPGDGNPCMCAPADVFTETPERVCEICRALEALGYPSRWNGMDPVLSFLGGLQEQLAPTP